MKNNETSVPWPFVKSRFHFNAFSFDKVDIFTRFGLVFTGLGKRYRKRTLKKKKKLIVLVWTGK